MAWMEHGLQISLKRYVLSMEDKMAAGAFGCARNYGCDGCKSYRDTFEVESNSTLITA